MYMNPVHSFINIQNKFINDLRVTFPEQERRLEKYQKKGLDMISKPEEEQRAYIKAFIDKYSPYEESLIKCDYSFLENVVIIDKFDLQWPTLSDNNRKVIFQYIQNLYVVGNMLFKEEEVKEYTKEMMKNLETITKDDVSDNNMEDITSTISQMFGISKDSPMNGLISNITKEISNSDNPAKILQSLVSGDEKYIKKLGEKSMKNLDKKGVNREQLAQEALKMQEFLNANMGGANTGGANQIPGMPQMPPGLDIGALMGMMGGSMGQGMIPNVGMGMDPRMAQSMSVAQGVIPNNEPKQIMDKKEHKKTKEHKGEQRKGRGASTNVIKTPTQHKK